MWNSHGQGYSGPPSIFVSGASNGLKAYRQKVAEVARKQGFIAHEQRDFPSYDGKLYQQIAELVRDARAVFFLVGPAYGFPAPPAPGEPLMSYTHFEWALAQRWKKPMHFFLAEEAAVASTYEVEPAPLPHLQAAFIDRLRTSGTKFDSFRDMETLLDHLCGVNWGGWHGRE
jgi:hypothetical protein